jgi:hypothetical protein
MKPVEATIPILDSPNHYAFAPSLVSPSTGFFPPLAVSLVTLTPLLANLLIQ